MDDHRYSTFALDLYWAAPTTEIEQHLTECDRCRAYVAHLAAIDGKPFAVPVRRKRSWFVGAAVLALAIVVVIIAWPRHPVVTIKGEPAVQVLVHRGTTTTVWNATPVHPGDALAIRLACDGMAYATVVVPDGVAFDGACQDGVLPFTLVVDDQPGAETVAVVLSQTSLDPSALHHAVDQQTRDAGTWTTRFTFPKELP